MRNWFSQRHVAQTVTDTPTLAPSPKVRAVSRDALHVFVLTSFAVAQPVYDRLGDRPAFLVDQDVSPATLAVLVFLLSIVLPATIVFIETALACWKRRFQDSVHALVVFASLVLLSLPICLRFNFLPCPLMLILALAAGSYGLFKYFESPRVRSLVTWAAPGIFLFPVVFWSQYSRATAISGPSSTPSSKWEPHPVVLLVFDEFCGSTLMTPEREIDSARFPNFAALSRQSTWFRNAASVNPLTIHAVPAILSGKYSESNFAPGPADLPQNLFSALTLAGDYELAAFEPVSNLAPRSQQATGDRVSSTWAQTRLLADILWRVYLFHVTPSDYRDSLPLVPRIWFGLHNSAGIDPMQRRGVFQYGWNDRRDDQFQHFLDCIDGSPRPVLYFGHFLLPHVPWCYLPSGRRYFDDQQGSESLCLESDGKIADPVENDDLAATRSQQRYLLQLMYVDSLIGKLLKRLDETGVLDRCLLIVTADHGVSFRAQQPRRWLVPGNQDDILSIPLFVKRPRQTVGETSDRVVESVDILPTIADVLGLTLQAPVDGWSVFDESHPERTQLTVREVTTITRFDPAIIKESKTPAVLRQRFGNGSDTDAIFRIGPHPELIGRTVQSLPRSPEPQMEIQLLRYGDEVGDAPKATRPCFYEGRLLLPSSADEPVDIAIAINGTIQAVTRTNSRTVNRGRWDALVPESAFHVGRNEVQFLVVNGPDGRLTPCIISEPAD